jgi:hypothetical protein
LNSIMPESANRKRGGIKNKPSLLNFFLSYKLFHPFFKFLPVKHNYPAAIQTLDLKISPHTDYPPVEHFEHWEDEPLELASIDGIIADGEPHLHAVVSDSEKAYSGHLEEGCRVLYLAEIVIVEINSLNLTRVRNEKNILKLISRKEKSQS